MEDRQLQLDDFPFFFFYVYDDYCKPKDFKTVLPLSQEPLIAQTCAYMQNEQEDLLSLPI